MDEDQPGRDSEMQGQIDDLRSRADEAEHRADASESRADEAEHRAEMSESRANEADLRAEVSESRADKASLRADDSEVRADKAEGRTDAGDVRSEEDRRRLTKVEGRVDVHEELIAELHAEGLINEQQAVHLQEALRSSRGIGAAIGIVMVNCKVTEVEAFAILSRASQHSNRKLRTIAEQVVHSGDVSNLPRAETPRP